MSFFTSFTSDFLDDFEPLSNDAKTPEASAAFNARILHNARRYVRDIHLDISTAFESRTYFPKPQYPLRRDPAPNPRAWYTARYRHTRTSKTHNKPQTAADLNARLGSTTSKPEEGVPESYQSPNGRRENALAPPDAAEGHLEPLSISADDLPTHTQRKRKRRSPSPLAPPPSNVEGEIHAQEEPLAPAPETLDEPGVIGELKEPILEEDKSDPDPILLPVTPGHSHTNPSSPTQLSPIRDNGIFNGPSSLPTPETSDHDASSDHESSTEQDAASEHPSIAEHDGLLASTTSNSILPVDEMPQDVDGQITDSEAAPLQALVKQSVASLHHLMANPHVTEHPGSDALAGAVVIDDVPVAGTSSTFRQLHGNRGRPTSSRFEIPETIEKPPRKFVNSRAGSREQKATAAEISTPDNEQHQEEPSASSEESTAPVTGQSIAVAHLQQGPDLAKTSLVCKECNKTDCPRLVRSWRGPKTICDKCAHRIREQKKVEEQVAVRLAEANAEASAHSEVEAGAEANARPGRPRRRTAYSGNAYKDAQKALAGSTRRRSSRGRSDADDSFAAVSGLEDPFIDEILHPKPRSRSHSQSRARKSSRAQNNGKARASRSKPRPKAPKKAKTPGSTPLASIMKQMFRGTPLDDMRRRSFQLENLLREDAIPTFREMLKDPGYPAAEPTVSEPMATGPVHLFDRDSQGQAARQGSPARDAPAKARLTRPKRHMTFDTPVLGLPAKKVRLSDADTAIAAESSSPKRRGPSHVRSDHGGKQFDIQVDGSNDASAGDLSAPTDVQIGIAEERRLPERPPLVGKSTNSILSPSLPAKAKHAARKSAVRFVSQGSPAVGSRRDGVPDNHEEHIDDEDQTTTQNISTQAQMDRAHADFQAALAFHESSPQQQPRTVSPSRGYDRDRTLDTPHQPQANETNPQHNGSTVKETPAHVAPINTQALFDQFSFSPAPSGTPTTELRDQPPTSSKPPWFACSRNPVMQITPNGHTAPTPTPRSLFTAPSFNIPSATRPPPSRPSASKPSPSKTSLSYVMNAHDSSPLPILKSQRFCRSPPMNETALGASAEESQLDVSGFHVDSFLDETVAGLADSQF